MTVDECTLALETCGWEVGRATKYLKVKQLLGLGLADVHRCQEVLQACGWDLQCAADKLLHASRIDVPRTTNTSHNTEGHSDVVEEDSSTLQSIASEVSSSQASAPTAHVDDTVQDNDSPPAPPPPPHRPASPEVLDI